VDKAGQSNLSIVSSCVHLGADPALMAMIMRPRAVPRHSVDNMVETRFMTINHVTTDIYRKAHQTSARYPKEVSEFQAVGLTEEYLGEFPAPYVGESVVKIGLELVRILPIPENDTEMVIAAIHEVHFRESDLLKDGSLSLARTGSVAVTGLDHYHQLQSLARLSYAKPDEDLEDLET
jgi:flavin reductase (DIM6/NTAB) family NADH-FMN oxidoreductase RutF